MMMANRTASFLAFLALFFSLLFCCAPTTASTNTLGISVRDSSFFLSPKSADKTLFFLLACLLSFFFCRRLIIEEKFQKGRKMRLLSVLSLSL
jgi:hypothetical protein